MCGRFHVTVDLVEYLRKWNRSTSGWLSPEDFERKIRNGEIYPTDYCPVMIANDNNIGTQVMQWGLKRSWSKAPLINARSETVEHKSTFKHILRNRCIIPSDGFYEWSHEGRKTVQKYLFTLPDTNKLYMAGLYEQTDDGYRFIILTTCANQWMREIHDRMPVILSVGECKKWLYNKSFLCSILERSAIEMARVSV